MALIRPRLTDHYNVPLTQEEAGFAIPFLDEDIPLCVDPFLLWKSPSQQEHGLDGPTIPFRGDMQKSPNANFLAVELTPICYPRPVP
jgi:hypothetical protein